MKAAKWYHATNSRRFRCKEKGCNRLHEWGQANGMLVYRCQCGALHIRDAGGWQAENQGPCEKGEE